MRKVVQKKVKNSSILNEYIRLNHSKFSSETSSYSGYQITNTTPIQYIYTNPKLNFYYRYISSETDPKVSFLETQAVRMNHKYNWASVIRRIKSFEAKYNLSTKAFRKAYDNRSINIINKIEVNDLEEWLHLNDLYYF